MIAKDYVPPGARGDFDQYQFVVSWSITSFRAQQGAVWEQSFPIAGAFDDDLVADVGQPIQGTVAEDGVVEEAQPFVHSPVAGDDEAGRPMAIVDQFVEIGRLLGGEPVQTEVVEDEQIGGQEGPETTIHRVVHSGLGHGLEEVIGVAEAHGVAGADGRVAQGLSQKALADASRSHQEDVLVLVQKLQ